MQTKSLQQWQTLFLGRTWATFWSLDLHQIFISSHEWSECCSCAPFNLNNILGAPQLCRHSSVYFPFCPPDIEFAADVKVDFPSMINLELKVKIDRLSASLVAKVLGWTCIHAHAWAWERAHTREHVASIRFTFVISRPERCTLFNSPLSQQYCRRGSGQ